PETPAAPVVFPATVPRLDEALDEVSLDEVSENSYFLPSHRNDSGLTVRQVSDLTAGDVRPKRFQKRDEPSQRQRSARRDRLPRRGISPGMVLAPVGDDGKGLGSSAGCVAGAAPLAGVRGSGGASAGTGAGGQHRAVQRGPRRPA